MTYVQWECSRFADIILEFSILFVLLVSELFTSCIMSSNRDWGPRKSRFINGSPLTKTWGSPDRTDAQGRLTAPSLIDQQCWQHCEKQRFSSLFSISRLFLVATASKFRTHWFYFALPWINTVFYIIALICFTVNCAWTHSQPDKKVALCEQLVKGKQNEAKRSSTLHPPTSCGHPIRLGRGPWQKRFRCEISPNAIIIVCFMFSFLSHNGLQIKSLKFCWNPKFGIFFLQTFTQAWRQWTERWQKET